MSLPKNAEANKTNFALGSSRQRDRCALLTGHGPSAVAVIGVRSANAIELISACFVPSTDRELCPGQIRYGHWARQRQQNDSEHPIAAAESVVVAPLAVDELEIHCHGGRAASTRIIDDLRALGAVRVPSAEWVGDPQQPLLIREAERVLRVCLTAPTAAIAMDQVRGAMLDWCSQSLAMIGDSGDGDSGDEVLTDDVLKGIRAAAQPIRARDELGMRLGHRHRVVLLGPPNVGKSSLVNAIAGYDRSITMDRAGTTRDVLHADTVVAGVPIRLSDTAGLRASGEPIEQQGVERAQIAAEEADLIVLVSAPGTAAIVPPAGKKLLRVLNKADLNRDDAATDDAIMPTVATMGQGINELIAAIAGALMRFPASGTPVPVTQRQIDLLDSLAKTTEAKDACRLLTKLIHG